MNIITLFNSSQLSIDFNKNINEPPNKTNKVVESKIQWTNTTWNPATGCNKISAGCKFCYAENLSLFLQKKGVPGYSDGFNLQLHEHRIKQMLDVKRYPSGTRVFVNSMSDLFHEKIPLDFTKKVFDVMNKRSDIIFQILTKRAEYFHSVASQFKWGENIWMGVSVEDHRVKNRIDILGATPPKVKFVSFEPLIGSVGEVDLSKIHWSILGGESGGYKNGKPQFRPCDLEWMREIIKQAPDGHAIFVKQLGTSLAYKYYMEDGKGGDFDKFPSDLKLRNYPQING